MLDVTNKVIEATIVIPEAKYIRYLIIIAIALAAIFSIFLFNLFGFELSVFRLIIPMAIVGLLIPYNIWRNKYTIVGKIIFKNHEIIFEKDYEKFNVELNDIKKIVFEYGGFYREIVSYYWLRGDRYKEGHNNVLCFEFRNQFRSSEKLHIFLEDVIQKENLMAYLNYYKSALKVKVNFKDKR